MVPLTKQIALYFSSDPSLLEDQCKEDDFEMVVCYKLSDFDKPLPAQVNLQGLSARDVLEVRILDSVNREAASLAFYSSKNEEYSWTDFCKSYDSLDKDDELYLKLRIGKETRNHVLSIYCIDLYVKHLEQHNLKSLLACFGRLIGGQNFIFECQNERVQVQTRKIAFVALNVTPVQRDLIDDAYSTEKIINKANYLCCNDYIGHGILPSDFLVRVRTENDSKSLRVANVLNRLAIAYALCFIADFLSINGESIIYKINGYKVLSGEIKMSDIESDCAESWVKVYSWIYHGGNTNDKMAIARNIISLNIEDIRKLTLNAKVQEAIDSNYRIYEKENVKQYIEVRNDVSKQLRIYQKDIIGIVDSFNNDCKKMLFTFLTFIFTSVLIRVLAKNITSVILIPNEIAIILLIYCFISLGYFKYDRWELDNKIRFFDEQYNDTRSFYKEILSQSEMEELFLDKAKNGKYIAFQNERKTKYRKFWYRSVLICIIGLLSILFINNYASIIVILDKIVCCIQSM